MIKEQHASYDSAAALVELKMILQRWMKQLQNRNQVVMDMLSPRGRKPRQYLTDKQGDAWAVGVDLHMHLMMLERVISENGELSNEYLARANQHANEQRRRIHENMESIKAGLKPLNVATEVEVLFHDYAKKK